MVLLLYRWWKDKVEKLRSGSGAAISDEYDSLFKNDKTPLFLKLRQTSAGEILMLSPMGLYKYSSEALFIPSHPNQLPTLDFTELDEDLEGNLWLLTEKELFCLKKGGILQSYPLSKELRGAIQLKVVNNKKIFLLSRNRDKLWSLDSSTGKYVDIAAGFSLLSQISFIEKDQESNLWLTTMGDGIYCIFDHDFNSYTSFDGLSSSYINNIREDHDKSILICTENGLNRLQKGNIQKEYWIDELDIQFDNGKRGIKDILPIKNGKYLATINGYSYLIDSLENSSETLGIYPVTRFSVYSQDSLVLISQGKSKHDRKLNFYHLGTMQKRKPLHVLIDYVGNNLSVFPKKNQNAYWLNPGNGLFLLQGDSLTKYSLPEGVSSEEHIKQIISGPDGNIWFASDKGVFMYEDNHLIWFNEKEGWPIFPCRQILFDNHGNMWLATPQGLYCWRKGKLVQYKAYGLDIRSLMIDSANRLWMGTSLGAISVDLENFPFESRKPPLILEQIKLDDTTVPIGELREFTENQSLHITYCAISFVDPKNIQYAYKLNDQSAWQITANRTLDINNLQAGEYQLKIKARKFNSDWSEPKLLDFQVKAPWYKRWWAYVGYVALLFSLLLLISYFWGNYTKSQALAKNKQAIEMGQLKLQALQSQLNPHFIFNALNVIQGYVLKHDIAASNLYISQFSDLMRRFLESSKKNELLLREEIELLNLFVEMEQLCYRDRFRYFLEIAPDINPDLIHIPSMLLQPFVENAIHHGLLQKEGMGTLRVIFKRQGSKMNCVIDDDGIGMDKSREIQMKSGLSHNSRGMQIVSERVSIQNLSGKDGIDIQVEDKLSAEGESGGTSVKITWVPKKE